ncbi:MAG: GNAT family N-acetyltransferase, partial [Salinibacterium amurskyense]
MRAPEFTIRRTTVDDWREVRTLRLEMLADTPMGFAERLDSARTATEADWRSRALRGQNPMGISVAA